MSKIPTLALLAIFGCGPALAADTKAQPSTMAAEAQMTPQQEKMKSCNDKAKDMKGDDRKAFMKTGLSAKPEKPKSKMAMCNEKTKGMTKAEADKTRSECMKG
jgi:hypothetical protein